MKIETFLGHNSFNCNLLGSKWDTIPDMKKKKSIKIIWVDSLLWKLLDTNLDRNVVTHTNFVITKEKNILNVGIK